MLYHEPDLVHVRGEHDLLFTGGSDYHGEVRPGTSLAGGGNVFVPPELLEKMKERLVNNA